MTKIEALHNAIQATCTAMEAAAQCSADVYMALMQARNELEQVLRDAYTEQNNTQLDR